MRTESDIRHKLKQVRFRHRKKRVKRGLARHPENCVWNDENPSLPGCPKFCSHRDRSGYLCDSRYGGERVVADCLLFQAAQTAEEIKVEFDHFIETASKEELAREVPEFMALLWTLGDHPDEFEVEEIEETESSCPAVPEAEGACTSVVVKSPDTNDILHQPWYIRVLRYLLPWWRNE